MSERHSITTVPHPADDAVTRDPRLRRLRAVDLHALVYFIPDPGRWEITGVTRDDAIRELARRGVHLGGEAATEPVP